MESDIDKRPCNQLVRVNLKLLSHLQMCATNIYIHVFARVQVFKGALQRLR